MAETFATYLADLMNVRKIGVNKLAELSGVSGAQISRIINGKRAAPMPRTIKKLADALQVDYQSMMQAAGHL